MGVSGGSREIRFRRSLSAGFLSFHFHALPRLWESREREGRDGSPSNYEAISYTFSYQRPGKRRLSAELVFPISPPIHTPPPRLFSPFPSAGNRLCFELNKAPAKMRVELQAPGGSQGRRRCRRRRHSLTTTTPSNWQHLGIDCSTPRLGPPRAIQPLRHPGNLVWVSLPQACLDYQPAATQSRKLRLSLCLEKETIGRERRGKPTPRKSRAPPLSNPTEGEASGEVRRKLSLPHVSAPTVRLGWEWMEGPSDPLC